MDEGFEIEQTDTNPLNEELSPMEAARSLVDIELQLKNLEAQKKFLKEMLFTVMKQHDTLQLKTGSYTIYRGKKYTPTVWNMAAVKQSLDARNIPYHTEEKFATSMNEVFKKLEQQGTLIEGIDMHVTEYVGVRVTKK